MKGPGLVSDERERASEADAAGGGDALVLRAEAEVVLARELLDLLGEPLGVLVADLLHRHVHELLVEQVVHLLLPLAEVRVLRDARLEDVLGDHARLGAWGKREEQILPTRQPVSTTTATLRSMLTSLSIHVSSSSKK